MLLWGVKSTGSSLWPPQRPWGMHHSCAASCCHVTAHWSHATPLQAFLLPCYSFSNKLSPSRAGEWKKCFRFPNEPQTEVSEIKVARNIKKQCFKTAENQTNVSSVFETKQEKPNRKVEAVWVFYYTDSRDEEQQFTMLTLKSTAPTGPDTGLQKSTVAQTRVKRRSSRSVNRFPCTLHSSHLLISESTFSSLVFCWAALVTLTLFSSER